MLPNKNVITTIVDFPTKCNTCTIQAFFAMLPAAAQNALSDS